MFAYITGSPFVFTQLYGFSARQYGLLFGLNAAGLIAASQLNSWLLRRYSYRQLLQATTLRRCWPGWRCWGWPARTGAASGAWKYCCSGW